MNEVADKLIRNFAGPPSPTRWKGRDSMTLVHELNERCVAGVQRVANSPTLGNSLPCLSEHRELWMKLDTDGIRALAGLPFVVADVCFQSLDWWDANGDVKSLADGATTATLPADVSEQLTQETLMFAWQTARWNRLAAQMLFGMRADVAKRIASLSPQQVREVAQQGSSALRLRWHDDVRLWGDWLMAAIARDAEQLDSIRRHLELRFCGELC